MKELDDLVARCLLRESGAFDAIAEVLKLKGRKTYEQTLVSRFQDNKVLANKLRKRFGPLAGALGAGPIMSGNTGS